MLRFAVDLSRMTTFELNDRSGGQGFSAMFAEERRRFLRWLEAFESVSQTRAGGMSRWYRGKVLTAYCRSGTLGVRLRGGHALCLANVEVRTAFRGKGFFASLITAVRSEPAFPFDRIEIEAVQNDGFAVWLAVNGFQRFGDIGAPVGAANSFNLDLKRVLPYER
jgi:hypothetical protein